MDKIIHNGDILVMIMKMLNTDDRMTLMKVHKNFIETFVKLLATFDTFNIEYDREIQQIMCKNAEQFTKIHVSGCIHRLNWSRLENLTNLTSITLEDLSLRLSDVYSMGRMSNLKSLVIRNCNYFSYLLQDSKFPIPSLVNLELGFHFGLKLFISNCTNLKFVKLTQVRDTDLQYFSHRLLPVDCIANQVRGIVSNFKKLLTTNNMLYCITSSLNSQPSVYCEFFKINGNNSKFTCENFSDLPFETLQYIQIGDLLGKLTNLHVKCPLLRSISCRGFQSSNNDFAMVDLPKFKHLQTFNVSNCFIDMSQFVKSFKEVNAIKSLNVESCGFYKVTAISHSESKEHFCSSILNLSITASYTFIHLLSKYSNSFKNVENLCIKYFPDIHFNHLIKIISRHFPNLKYLTIESCNLHLMDRLTAKNLIKLRKLTYLSIIRCQAFDGKLYDILYRDIDIVEIRFSTVIDPQR